MGFFDNLIKPDTIINAVASAFPSLNIRAEIDKAMAEINQAKQGTASELEVIKRVLLQNNVTRTQINQIAGAIENSKIQGIPAFAKRYATNTIRSWGQGNANVSKDAPQLALPKTNQKRTFTKL